VLYSKLSTKYYLGKRVVLPTLITIVMLITGEDYLGKRLVLPTLVPDEPW
jgi:hypothetical protein